MKAIIAGNAMKHPILCSVEGSISPLILGIGGNAGGGDWFDPKNVAKSGLCNVLATPKQQMCKNSLHLRQHNFFSVVNPTELCVTNGNQMTPWPSTYISRKHIQIHAKETKATLLGTWE